MPNLLALHDQILRAPEPLPVLAPQPSQPRRSGWICYKTSMIASFFLVFFFFFPFLGLLLRHMEVPRLGNHSNAGSELRLRPTPQLAATLGP